MRLIAPILLLALVGCSTAPTDPTDRQLMIANAVEDIVSVGLVPVLAKNPTYVAEVRVAGALLGSFNGTTITPADVDTFLARLQVAPEDARAVAGIVNAAWDTYQRRYAQQVGQALRPDVKLFLGAVAAGIERAIAAMTRDDSQKHGSMRGNRPRGESVNV